VKKLLASSCLLVLALTACTPAPEPPRPPEAYDRAIRLGAEWFLNNQNERFLHYAYYLNEGRHGEEQNLFRELATLWVVAMAADYLDDPRLHELAQRGFAHFETYFERDAAGDFMYVNVAPEPIGLGYSAFVILTLLELEHPRREEYLEQFTNGILSLQEPSGEYRTHFFSDLDANRDFFPGEACLALMSLYEETGDERILDSVRRSFLPYAAYWDRHNRATFAAWQIQAHERLHAATNFEKVREFVFAMADFIIRYHRPDRDCTGFWFDGVYVGSRVEAMNRAYKLARDVGDAFRTDCYRKFIREASDYLVDLQLSDATVHPEAAIGGFPGKREPKLRVDRNQHVVAGLIGARRSGALD
jgi:hypothetical protein